MYRLVQKKWEKLWPSTLVTENLIVFFNLHRPLNCCVEKLVEKILTFELQSAAFFWTWFLFPYFFIFIFVSKSFFVSLAPSFVHLSFLTSVYLFVSKSVRVFVCLFVVWLTFSSFIDSFLCWCLFWLKMHFALGLQSYDVSWTTAVNTFILQFDYWLIFIDISQEDPNWTLLWKRHG